MAKTVLVVGAGPTGMTAAIELRRAGFDVRVIDKAGHMAEHSQALVVQARTLEQFQRYGIAAQAVACGRRANEAKFFSDGKLIVDFTLDKVDSRYPFALFIPQTETEALLNAKMESLGTHAERNVELTRLEQAGGETRARLRHPDGRNEEIAPRWVIGCDGAHSTVRQLAGIPFQGEGVGMYFFLGDLVAEGPDAPDNALTIHVRHGDVVFQARLKDRVTRLIIALREEQGSERTGDLTVEDFQCAADRVGVRIKVSHPEWMTPFHVRDMQAKHYRSGSVFLAGDASHIHSPVGGQGMNTGIQDVANLAWKLASVARGADERLLDSYEEERGKVGEALLRFTKRGLKMASLSNPILEGLRDVLAPLLTRLEPVQRAAAGFVSETAIDYRGSSIVKDHGGDGDLRAGDRMPDLDVPGTDATLLANWTSLRHLAVVLDESAAAADAVQAVMPQVETVRLRPSLLDARGSGLLGREPKVLIVRPDGYLGYRGNLNDTAGLGAYAAQDALG